MHIKASFAISVQVFFSFLCVSSLKSYLKYIFTDKDECLNTELCGPKSICNNIGGGYFCTCLEGFNGTDPALPPGGSNYCIGTV